MNNFTLSNELAEQIEAACAELNRAKWRGQDDWFVWQSGQEVVSQSLYDDRTAEAAIYGLDAIAIATGIIAQDQLATAQKRIGELERLQAEQESIVMGVGAITCRNGNRHKRIDECIYCSVEQLQGERDALQADKERIIGDFDATTAYSDSLETRLAERAQKVEQLQGERDVLQERIKELDKLVSGYYGEAAKGWAKFREAEHEIEQLRAERDALRDERVDIITYGRIRMRADDWRALLAAAGTEKERTDADK